MQALDTHIARDGFHLRGTALSRVDGFSDVVFGFALTLLVVSLEVPRTYTELHESLRGFIPFAICFGILINIWFTHYEFFRRFGLHDLPTIALNATLLFFVLFYVYPLKFLFTLLVNNLFGQSGPAALMDEHQSVELMVLYGLGFAAIYLLFTGLYANAYRQRRPLELSALEGALTRTYIAEQLGMALIGLLSALLAILLPTHVAGFAGFAYFLIPIFKTAHGFWSGRQTRALRAQIV